MSNGMPLLPRQENDTPGGVNNFIVYANEVNPDTMPFDAWWANKTRGFGGDDGVEFLPIADIERQLTTVSLTSGCFELDITPSRLGIPFIDPAISARQRRGTRKPKQPRDT
jgi:hypothetical protein